MAEAGWFAEEIMGMSNDWYVVCPRCGAIFPVGLYKPFDPVTIPEHNIISTKNTCSGSGQQGDEFRHALQIGCLRATVVKNKK